MNTKMIEREICSEQWFWQARLGEHAKDGSHGLQGGAASQSMPALAGGSDPLSHLHAVTTFASCTTTDVPIPETGRVDPRSCVFGSLGSP